MPEKFKMERKLSFCSVGSDELDDGFNSDEDNEDDVQMPPVNLEA